MRNWIRFNESNQNSSKLQKGLSNDLVSYMETGKGDCGTVACIGGHAALLIAAENGQSAITVNFLGDASYKAREWLGLSSKQAAYLFMPGIFNKVNGKYVQENYPIPDNITLKDAIAVLENLRTTAREGKPNIDWGDMHRLYSEEQKIWYSIK